MTIGTGIALAAIWLSLGYALVKLRQPDWLWSVLILAVLASCCVGVS